MLVVRDDQFVFSGETTLPSTPFRLADNINVRLPPDTSSEPISTRSRCDDPAEVVLKGYREGMRGRVDSGARAIDVANAQPVVFSELGRELIDLLTSERLARVRNAPCG